MIMKLIYKSLSQRTDSDSTHLSEIIRARPKTIFGASKALGGTDTEYWKLWREGLNIFFSLINSGISVSVCLHFIMSRTVDPMDFSHGGCVAAEPRECTVSFWSNMHTTRSE